MRTQTKEKGVQRVRIRTIVGTVLTVIAPPIGILLLVWDLLDSLRKKAAGEAPTRSAREVPRRDGRQETGTKRHGHTPVQYSYDSCAATHRLEQLTVLYKAGLYTKEQYREARAKLLEKS